MAKQHGEGVRSEKSGAPARWGQLGAAFVTGAATIIAALILARSGTAGPLSDVLPTVTATETVTAAPVTVSLDTDVVTVAGPTRTVTVEPTGSDASGSEAQDEDTIAVVIRERYADTKIGPNQFRILDDRIPMYVGWEVRRDNVAVEGRDCAIRVTLEGPQDFETLPSSRCDLRPTYSDFTFWIDTPGEYSAVVVDETTGASGTMDFTVEL